MTIPVEALAWGRSIAYLFAATMIAVAGTYTPRLRWAMYLTAISFLLSASGAIFVACGQQDLRDQTLNIQTLLSFIVAFNWAHAIWRITRKYP